MYTELYRLSLEESLYALVLILNANSFQCASLSMISTTINEFFIVNGDDLNPYKWS